MNKDGHFYGTTFYNASTAPRSSNVLSLTQQRVKDNTSIPYCDAMSQTASSSVGMDTLQIHSAVGQITEFRPWL